MNNIITGIILHKLLIATAIWLCQVHSVAVYLECHVLDSKGSGQREIGGGAEEIFHSKFMVLLYHCA